MPSPVVPWQAAQPCAIKNTLPVLGFNATEATVTEGAADAGVEAVAATGKSRAGSVAGALVAAFASNVGCGDFTAVIVRR